MQPLWGATQKNVRDEFQIYELWHASYPKTHLLIQYLFHCKYVNYIRTASDWYFLKMTRITKPSWNETGRLYFSTRDVFILYLLPKMEPFCFRIVQNRHWACWPLPLELIRRKWWTKLCKRWRLLLLHPFWFLNISSWFWSVITSCSYLAVPLQWF